MMSGGKMAAITGIGTSISAMPLVTDAYLIASNQISRAGAEFIREFAESLSRNRRFLADKHQSLVIKR